MRSESIISRGRCLPPDQRVKPPDAAPRPRHRFFLDVAQTLVGILPANLASTQSCVSGWRDVPPDECRPHRTKEDK